MPSVFGYGAQTRPLNDNPEAPPRDVEFRTLCQTCCNISISKLKEVPWHEHSLFIPLIASAQICPMCKMILAGLRKEYAVEHQTTDNPGGLEQMYGPSGHFGVPMKVVLSLESPFLKAGISRRPEITIASGKALYFCLAMVGLGMPLVSGYLDISSPRSFILTNSRVYSNQSVEIEDRFAKLKILLDDDWQGNPSGESESGTLGGESKSTKTPVPYRVLDVGKNDGMSSDYIKLIETGSLRGDSSTLSSLLWIALSHRWGTSPQFMTTKDNYSAHFQSDVVAATRKLGLQYLWIDALCIIQDDEEDWNKEALKMGDIYHNSFCTIAAHTAVDNESGFLQSAMRTPESVHLGLNATDHEAQDNSFSVSLPCDFIMEVDNSPLSKRAWVLQERLLPNRILHFTPSQTYLESNGVMGTRSENGIVITTDQDMPSRPSIPREATQTLESPLNWFEIVERYTACGLTKERDKLIAIASLAKQIHTSTGVPYLAGLWQDRIHIGLLWAAKPPNQRSDLYRSASWSWALLKSQITFPKFLYEKNIIPKANIQAHAEFEAAWINGPAPLQIRGQRKLAIVGNVPDPGSDSQAIFAVMAEGGKLEPLADVARGLQLGCVYIGKEQLDKAKLEKAGILNTVCLDGIGLNDAFVRDVLDEELNKVGWIVKDLEDGRVSGTGVEKGKVFLVSVSAMKIAEYRDVLGITKNLVLFVSPITYTRWNMTMYERIGMGVVWGDAYFEGVHESEITIF